MTETKFYDLERQIEIEQDDVLDVGEETELILENVTAQQLKNFARSIRPELQSRLLVYPLWGNDDYSVCYHLDDWLKADELD